METIIVDCGPVQGPESLHDALACALEFPEYYGKNLDALYDCLTDVELPIRLVLMDFDHMAPWAYGFREVFHDAMAANPLLQILMD